MSKQYLITSRHLYSINKIETSKKDDFETLKRINEKVDGVAYNVLIIGEASNKVPLFYERVTLQFHGGF